MLFKKNMGFVQKGCCKIGHCNRGLYNVQYWCCEKGSCTNGSVYMCFIQRGVLQRGVVKHCIFRCRYQKSLGKKSCVICHMSPVTYHLTTTLCSLSCYDSPRRFGGTTAGGLVNYRVNKNKHTILLASYPGNFGKNIFDLKSQSLYNK